MLFSIPRDVPGKAWKRRIYAFLRYSLSLGMSLAWLGNVGSIIFTLFSPPGDVPGKAWERRIYAFLRYPCSLDMSLAKLGNAGSTHFYVILASWACLWQSLETQDPCIFTLFSLPGDIPGKAWKRRTYDFLRYSRSLGMSLAQLGNAGSMHF